MRARALAIALLAAALGPGAGQAQAAGPPILGDTYASAVFITTARVNAQVNPNELFTTFHFDYITEAAYQANVNAAKAPFAGASRSPLSTEASLGPGNTVLIAQRLLSGLAAATTYRYRVVATNTTTTNGPARAFTTQSDNPGPLLADGRGWEMVSPVQKNGGRIDGPGAIAGGGVLQAAAQGGSVTYGSSASFGEGAQGAPPASQYLSARGSGGWSVANLTVPILAGSYDTESEGVPYQLFSPDLARGLLLNGKHCRGEGSGCGVANPPLAGTDAPQGLQNYYLREGGSFTALLGAANAGFLTLSAAAFDLRLAGASADLRHGVLSSCAALSANATEVPLGAGCDPEETNLYEYSPAGALSLVNLLPGETQGTPGVALAAKGGAISADGSRVYWTDQASGNLYLRAGGQTKQVDEDAGGGGSFETASSDGSLAYFTKAGHLWRYLASSDAATDITPAGGVAGVLGASADGLRIFFQDATGLRLWKGTTATLVPGADAADESDWPPAHGTARVSADGTKLLFLSSAPLSEFDNTDLISGQADSQVYLYDTTGAGTLTCISCNPTGERPIGPSSIPGSVPNGTELASTDAYKPRVLSANGRRVFFDSADTLAAADTNFSGASGAGIPDAYQWEAQGEGSCTKAGGCVNLISGGRSAGGARFVDASADGSDAFFLTDASLVGTDPGAVDIYDARIGGGFPDPPSPIPCEGDACQVLAPEPTDPTLTSLLAGKGNPPARYHRLGKKPKPSKNGHNKRRHKKQKRGGGGGRR